MTSTAARRSKVAAQKQAAKQKRQVYLVAGLCVVLVVMLGLELPKLLKSSGGSTAAPAAAPAVVPTVVPPVTSSKPSAALRAILKQAPRDVFVQTGSGSPTTLGSVSTPPGLHDPFASPTTSEAAVAPVVQTTAPKVPLLPGKIVLGTPGAGKVASSGWIVILASIPTAAGQSSATSFAAQAEKAGVGSTSVLNSSNRRPLRGGFWVVYTGPYSSLTQVSSAADNVHKSGFSSAYIRELIVYKAKPAAKHKTKKKK